MKEIILKLNERLYFEEKNGGLYDMIFCFLKDKHLMEDFIAYCDRGYFSCEGTVWDDKKLKYVGFCGENYENKKRNN